MVTRLTEQQRRIVQRFLRKKTAGTSKVGDVHVRPLAPTIVAYKGSRFEPGDRDVVIKVGGSSDAMPTIAPGTVRFRSGKVVTSKDTLNRVAKALEAGSAATGAFKQPSLPRPHVIVQADRQAD